MVTNIAMTTRGVNVLFHSVSPVVSHPASVHGGGSHLTDHGARRTEPSSIHGGRAVHGGAGRPLEMSTPSSGPGGRPRGSGPSYSHWASWSRQAGPSMGERGPGAPDAERAKAGPPTGERVVRRQPSPVRICCRYGGRGPENPAPRPLARPLASPSARTPAAPPRGESSLPTHSPMARTRGSAHPGESRIDDVTSARIVRAQLTRIELRWILSSSAHIVRARMDSVEQAWKVILGSSEWCWWDSWGDPGRGRVQICHKGASGWDRPRRKPRNINDSLPVFRLDPGLCGRFGQLAPPRAPW